MTKKIPFLLAILRGNVAHWRKGKGGLLSTGVPNDGGGFFNVITVIATIFPEFCMIETTCSWDACETSCPLIYKWENLILVNNYIFTLIFILMYEQI